MARCSSQAGLAATLSLLLERRALRPGPAERGPITAAAAHRALITTHGNPVAQWPGAGRGAANGTNSVLNSVELYDPNTELWTVTNSLVQPAPLISFFDLAAKRQATDCRVAAASAVTWPPLSCLIRPLGHGRKRLILLQTGRSIHNRYVCSPTDRCFFVGGENFTGTFAKRRAF